MSRESVSSLVRIESAQNHEGDIKAEELVLREEKTEKTLSHRVAI